MLSCFADFCTDDKAVSSFILVVICTVGAVALISVAVSAFSDRVDVTIHVLDTVIFNLAVSASSGRVGVMIPELDTVFLNSVKIWVAVSLYMILIGDDWFASPGLILIFCFDELVGVWL